MVVYLTWVTSLSNAEILTRQEVGINHLEMGGGRTSVVPGVYGERPIDCAEVWVSFSFISWVLS